MCDTITAGDEQYDQFSREKSIREQTIAESTAEDSSSQHLSHPEVITRGILPEGARVHWGGEVS